MNDFLLKDSNLHHPTLKVTDQVKKKTIQKIVKSFYLTRQTLEGVRKVFKEEIKYGLAVDPPIRSSLLMANTLVPPIWNQVDDVEKQFLSLDFGGTNVRIQLCQFNDKTINQIVTNQYEIPGKFKSRTLSQLFDFLANCINECLTSNHLPVDKQYSLGFICSYPMEINSINSGILTAWSKGFTCNDAIGQDVVVLLQHAIDRHKNNLKVKVTSIMNDTTAILASGSYLYPNCSIALGIGSGCNVCYLEKVQNIPKLNCSLLESNQIYKQVKYLPIDIELGAFGDSGILNFIKTKFDTELDYESENRLQFIFDKFIGGKYLGEIVRKVMIDLINKGVLLNGKVSERLKIEKIFTGKHVAAIQRKENPIEILKDLGYDEITDDDMLVVSYICALVSVRAASLVAICLSELIERCNRDNVTIVAAGSTVEKHPNLRKLIEDFTQEIVGTSKNVTIKLVENGAGKGGGIVAAIADIMDAK